MAEEPDARPEICRLPGCDRPVPPTEDGSVRRYCSPSHRAQARRLRRLAGEMGRPEIAALGAVPPSVSAPPGDGSDPPTGAGRQEAAATAAVEPPATSGTDRFAGTEPGSDDQPGSGAEPAADDDAAHGGTGGPGASGDGGAVADEGALEEVSGDQATRGDQVRPGGGTAPGSALRSGAGRTSATDHARDVRPPSAAERAATLATPGAAPSRTPAASEPGPEAASAPAPSPAPASGAREDPPAEAGPGVGTVAAEPAATTATPEKTTSSGSASSGSGRTGSASSGPAAGRAASRDGGRAGRPAAVVGIVGIAAAVTAAVLLNRHDGGPDAHRRPGPTTTATVTVSPNVNRLPVAQPGTDDGGASKKPRSEKPGAPRGGHGTAPSAGVRPPAVQPRASVSGVRYGFESSRQGWSIFYGGKSLGASVAAGPVYEGSHALRLSVTGSDYGAVGVDHPPGVHSGTVVTYRVWTDGSTSGTAIPFVQDTGYKNHFVSGASVELSGSRGWRSVRWTVPGVSVLGIGLQVHSSSGHGTLALDAITW